MFDSLFFGLVVFLVVVTVGNSETGKSGSSEFYSDIFLLVFGLLLEILVLQFFGNTPGKALLGIRIVDASGTRANFSQIILRTVWFSVVSLFFIPVISQVSWLFARNRVLANRETLWDEWAGTSIQAVPMSMTSATLRLGFGYFAVLVLSVVLGVVVGMMRPATLGGGKADGATKAALVLPSSGSSNASGTLPQGWKKEHSKGNAIASYRHKNGLLRARLFKERSPESKSPSDYAHNFIAKKKRLFSPKGIKFIDESTLHHLLIFGYTTSSFSQKKFRGRVMYRIWEGRIKGEFWHIVVTDSGPPTHNPSNEEVDRLVKFLLPTT